jgi:hypothetical protein
VASSFIDADQGAALRAAALPLKTELQDIRDKIDLVRSTRPHPHYSIGFRLPGARWGEFYNLVSQVPGLYAAVESAYVAAHHVNEVLAMRVTRAGAGQIIGVIEEDGLDDAYETSGRALEALDVFLAAEPLPARPSYASPVGAVDLMPEQEDLLVRLVEADRNLRPVRDDFRLVSLGRTGGPSVYHKGLPHDMRGRSLAPLADFQELIAARFVRKVRQAGRGDAAQWYLAVTPAGFRQYEAIKQRQGETIEQVETETRRYLDREIRKRYPEAFVALSRAEELVWSSDPENSATRVGHDCREAMQVFANEVAQRFRPSDMDAGPTPKIRAALRAAGERLGSTERDALDTLTAWWSSVYDLAQRQEHGAQREGQPLVYEDSRRLVFMTTIVMSEIDRSFSRYA